MVGVAARLGRRARGVCPARERGSTSFLCPWGPPLAERCRARSRGGVASKQAVGRPAALASRRSGGVRIVLGGHSCGSRADALARSPDHDTGIHFLDRHRPVVHGEPEATMKWRVPPPPVPARVASSASTARNLIKTGAQILVFWCTFLVIIPTIILHVEHAIGWSIAMLDQDVLRVTGGVLFTLGGGLGLHSAWVMTAIGHGTPLPFDCPRRLVIRGAYRCVRNPMAIGGLMQGMAVGLMIGSWGVLAYTLCGAMLWNFLVRKWEEDDLHARFGAEYDAYRQAVRCWWPRARPVDAAPPADFG